MSAARRLRTFSSLDGPYADSICKHSHIHLCHTPRRTDSAIARLGSGVRGPARAARPRSSLGRKQRKLRRRLNSTNTVFVDSTIRQPNMSVLLRWYGRTAGCSGSHSLARALVPSPGPGSASKAIWSQITQCPISPGSIPAEYAVFVEEGRRERATARERRMSYSHLPRSGDSSGSAAAAAAEAVDTPTFASSSGRCEGEGCGEARPVPLPGGSQS